MYVRSLRVPSETSFPWGWRCVVFAARRYTLPWPRTLGPPRRGSRPLFQANEISNQTWENNLVFFLSSTNAELKALALLVLGDVRASALLPGTQRWMGAVEMKPSIFSLTTPLLPRASNSRPPALLSDLSQHAASFHGSSLLLFDSLGRLL